LKVFQGGSEVFILQFTPIESPAQPDGLIALRSDARERRKDNLAGIGIELYQPPNNRKL
jgi:hypothetical protein